MIRADILVIAVSRLAFAVRAADCEVRAQRGAGAEGAAWRVAFVGAGFAVAAGGGGLVSVTGVLPGGWCKGSGREIHNVACALVRERKASLHMVVRCILGWVKEREMVEGR